MTKEEMVRHVQAVIDLLPENFRQDADISSDGFARLYKHLYYYLVSIYVTDTGYSCQSRYCIKVEPYYATNFKKKHWRVRRDGTFSYQAVADYIKEVVTYYLGLEAARSKGLSVAEERISSLKASFISEPLLSSLNIQLDMTPVNETVSGDVAVDITADEKVVSPQYGTVHRFVFDGQTFSGDLRISGISVEQFVALMTVLRFDQLNVLELLPLADDSILGPVIRAAISKDESNDQPSSMNP